MNMRLKSYTSQRERWPKDGRHILANHDNENVVVYQAYRREIGEYAIENQRFGGAFSFSRMSWIKPNFLWMMYRSGWGTKPDQESILAVTIPRSLFEEILEAAVPSSWISEMYPDHDSWKSSVHASEVRLQWDPDHAPNGTPLKRRAIQLGLRGRMLRRYAEEEVVRIEDMSGFVAEQREALRADPAKLIIPEEFVYQPVSAKARVQVGLDSPEADGSLSVTTDLPGAVAV